VRPVAISDRHRQYLLLCPFSIVANTVLGKRSFIRKMINMETGTASEKQQMEGAYERFLDRCRPAIERCGGRVTLLGLVRDQVLASLPADWLPRGGAR